VQGYREKAGMSQPIHPHLFRHQMLTYLTTKGLSDAQIQLISGHESKKSLEVYPACWAKRLTTACTVRTE
jgi:integrase/recombinase XerD